MAAQPTHALQPYLDAVRATLTAAMCVENFASQLVERHNKPEVEARLVVCLNVGLFFFLYFVLMFLIAVVS